MDPAVLRQAGARQPGADVDGHDRCRTSGFHQRACTRPRANPLIGETARLHWHHLRRVTGAVLAAGQGSAKRCVVRTNHEAIARAIAAGDRRPRAK
jgi:DNA-binding FadR family transcriptional regulator